MKVNSSLRLFFDGGAAHLWGGAPVADIAHISRAPGRGRRRLASQLGGQDTVRLVRLGRR